MENNINYKQLLNFSDELERMCQTYINGGSCAKCPLLNMNLSDCFDITEISQETFDVVQAWSKDNPKDYKPKVGDKVRIENSRYVYTRFVNFIMKYGTDKEKVYWNFDIMPEKDIIFTVSSINKELTDEGIAIITRDVSEEWQPTPIEVFMVDVRGLKEAFK